MSVVCFLAEFGDRSQITAVALAAANNVWGVWLGGAVVSANVSLGSHIVHIYWCRLRGSIGW